MTAKRTQSAMTLIEVMVAIAIIAMISTLLYSAFIQTSRNKTRIEAESDRYHEIQVGMERMVRELSMAYVSAQLNPNEAMRPVITAFVGKEEGSGSRLDFTSFSHIRLYRDAHESDQNELSYFITDHPDNSDRKVLARREARRIDADPLTCGTTQILIDDVRELKLSFLDPQTLEWTTTWDTTQGAGQPNRLPMQVKILLTVPDPHDPQHDLTIGTRAALPIQYALNHAVYTR
jgi:general secretion pathway protein J